MIIVNSGAQLDKAALAEFETQYGIKLPEDYKAFMLRNNGGCPEDDMAFEFVDAASSKSTSAVINYFYILFSEATTRNTDLKVVYNNLVRSRSLPSNFMPIAYDVFGNTICICVGEKDYGKVCFANHELEDPETGYMIISKVSDSFTEFVDKCYLYDD